MHQTLATILSNPKFKDQEKSLIERAFNFALRGHEGQKRFSGDDYITHPVSVAFFLFNLNLDSTTICAGLLHDILEDTDTTPEIIEKEFGKEITFLVQGVTKLGKFEYSTRPQLKRVNVKDHFNSLKRMFLAMAEDIRVILIKLADRYHNMETLKYLTKDDQIKIATETLEIYAPIAARLGMGKLKGQLEDLAFPYVYPEEYTWLIKQVKDKYVDRSNYIDRTKPVIKRYLTDEGINIIDIHSRAKHYYSLYQKMMKKELEIDKILDLVAIRIIVPDIKSCYEALGIIHNRYKPMPGFVKDYIALPKPNGYRSLHTTIFCEKGRIAEIQIRTPEMHDFAENGIAAHWSYTESGKKSVMANTKEIDWISQLKKFLSEAQSGDTISNLKIDFFKNRIFALTPKGDVKDLPEGATPIDFAFSIHTGLGTSIMGAKVNGKMVPISTELKNGDVVEIVKGKNVKPTMDWLKMVKTTEARRQIKSYLGITAVKDRDLEESISEKKPRMKPKRVSKITRASVMEPLINGQRGLLFKLAKCCSPTPKDKIKGYQTLNRGFSIHVVDCSNIKSRISNTKRIISATWSK